MEVVEVGVVECEWWSVSGGEQWKWWRWEWWRWEWWRWEDERGGK